MDIPTNMYVAPRSSARARHDISFVNNAVAFGAITGIPKHHLTVDDPITGGGARLTHSGVGAYCCLSAVLMRLWSHRGSPKGQAEPPSRPPRRQRHQRSKYRSRNYGDDCNDKRMRIAAAISTRHLPLGCSLGLLLFASPVVSVPFASHRRSKDAGAIEASSFDFTISGAGNRLDGLTVASVAADDCNYECEAARGGGGEGGDKDNEEIEATAGRANFLVIDAPASRAAAGVSSGDRLLAVNGIPVSLSSLREWIEATTASISTKSNPAPSSSPVINRLAVFPLVDIDWDPRLGGIGGKSPQAPTSQPLRHNTLQNSSSTSTLNHEGLGCSEGSQGSTCVIAPPLPYSTGEGFRATSSGFPLKGFLKVELVELEEAEVVFRPGDARRAILIREREDAAVAEEEKRERAVAEAKIALEIARREKEEEEKKAEAAAKAREAEWAREQAEADRREQEQREEEARTRREEEAARQSAEKYKKDVFKMRKEGKEFTFVAEYKEVGPMGLTFDLGNPLAMISEVVVGGTSHAAGVRVGDHLVRVNDRDTSKMKPTAAIKTLQRADWPRLLTFSVPESIAVEGGDQPLLLGLVVSEPEIVRGEYLMQAPKNWGGLRAIAGGAGAGAVDAEAVVSEVWSCEPRPMALADPPPACQRNLRLLSGGAEVGRGAGPVIALVKRGVCTFVEKAKHVQLAIAGDSTTDEAATNAMAGGGMVLLNGDDVLTEMPAGNLLTEDVRIPVAMIARGNGSSVEALLSWGVEVRAAIVPLGACPPVAAAITRPETAKDRKGDDDGGRFLVLSKTRGGADFDYRLARYGPGFGTGEAILGAGGAGTDPGGGVRGGTGAGAGAQPIVVADPFDGCDDKAYKVRVAGMFVAVERGGCSFSMKTLAAQRAGASGVIIVNTAEATLRAMADPGDGDKAFIPTVMVSASAGSFLSTAAAGSSRSPIFGRFIRESFDAGRG